MLIITLTIKRSIVSCDVDRHSHSYDELLDNITSILCRVCDELQEMELIEFKIGGFGEDYWPADIRHDLLCFLEQIDTLLSDLVGGIDTVLDFFEQGMQRKLIFTHTGSRVAVTCESYGNWVASASREDMERGALIGMLHEVVRTFASVVDQIFPDDAQHSWFKAWRAKAFIGEAYSVSNLSKRD